MLAVVASAAATLSGCGGGDEGPSRTVTLSPGEAALSVSGDEYFFDPEAVVASPGGRPLELTFRNDGSLNHNLRVERDDDDLGGTESFAGGSSRSATVSLDPGRYRLVCTVGDHEALGMKASLEVR